MANNCRKKSFTIKQYSDTSVQSVAVPRPLLRKSYLLVAALLAVSNCLTSKLRVPGTHIQWKYDCISSFKDHTS